ncbi:MAG: hypothetical protein AAFQ14_10280 [Cyanobacteria bacterium J06621_12]
MSPAKLLKLIGRFLCAVALVSIGYVTWYLIYSASSVICLESESGDTFSFGKALAINDNYIAVGDPKANRVAIYSYDSIKDKWSRTKEIYPPKNSIIERVGYGFGSSLVLNQNQLIIGAFSQPKTTTFDDDTESEEYKLTQQYHGAVYSLLLKPKERSFLQEIALPNSFKLTGYSLAIFNNKIALGATTEVEPYIEPGKVLIVDPTTLEVNKIIKPPSSEQKFADFGFVIDGNDDYLLVGSRGLTKQGGALLIDKAGKIEEISSDINLATPLSRAGSSVALADNFVAIGISSNFGDENILLLKSSAEGWSLVDVIPFGGSLNIAKSHLIVSSGEDRMMFTRMLYRQVHALVRLDKNQAEIESKIHWKLGSDFQFEAKGLIYADQLLLSHKGKVILQSMKNLPSSYLINPTFCKEK